jgi:DNA-binding MarR family transcriptional regulator
MFTDCYCTQFRRASNALTRVYDAALKPVGLRITQFSLLRSLGRLGEATSTQVAAELSLDRTTISRNVKLLIDSGWVEVVGALGNRERPLRLTAAGQRKIAEALPYFGTAQKTVERGATEYLQEPSNDRLMGALLNLQRFADETKALEVA